MNDPHGKKSDHNKQNTDRNSLLDGGQTKDQLNADANLQEVYVAQQKAIKEKKDELRRIQREKELQMGEMPQEFKNQQLKADEYERQKQEVEDLRLFEEEQRRKGIRKKEVKPY